jgi:hypothetical protein
MHPDRAQRKRIGVLVIHEVDKKGSQQKGVGSHF